MDRQEQHRIAMEEIRGREQELFVHYVKEAYDHGRILPGRYRPEDLIVSGIMGVTGEYIRASMKIYCGWICGTHANRQEAAITRAVAAKYSEEQLCAFVDACVTCSQGQEALTPEYSAMAKELLTLRRRPIIHRSRSR